MANQVKPTEKDDDSNELTDLDVRYVSAVGEPATGLPFLLAKAALEKKAKHYPWDQCISDQMDRYHDKDKAAAVCGSIKAHSSLQHHGKDANGSEDPDIWLGPDDDLTKLTEEARMTVEKQNENDLMTNLGTRLASAFGVETADNQFIQAVKALQAIAAKASGTPSDDAGAGRKPAYSTPTSPYKGGVPADDVKPGSGPSVAQNTTFGAKMMQQAEVLQGTDATNSAQGDVTLGTPVVKSLLSAMDQYEGQVRDPEAYRAAKANLAQAFSPQAEEDDMTSGMTAEQVGDLLYKGLEPVLDVIERLDQRLAAMEAANAEVAKGKKKKFEEKEDAGSESEEASADDHDEDDAEKSMAPVMKQLLDRVNAIEEARTTGAAQRAVAKSRVPVATTETTRASKSAGVWAGSPFETAARM